MRLDVESEDAVDLGDGDHAYDPNAYDNGMRRSQLAFVTDVIFHF